jgi:SAM-dependent methyltransferase
MKKLKDDFTTRSKLADIGRFYVNDFVKKVAAGLPPGTSLLDAGAGECVYKKYFTHCNYKSVDLGIGEPNWNYSRLDYVAPLHELPIEDGSFDAILCTQVLEHLQKPLESVKEMYRVLRPGGHLFMTAPMAQSEHQIPYDFFRYTSFGLKHICAEAGFREIRVTPMGGMFLRWAYEFPRLFIIFPETGGKRGKVNLARILIYSVKVTLLIIIRFLQMIFIVLDRFDKIRNDPFGWKLIARK